MKIGINFLPDTTWEQMSAQQFLNEALDLCEQADQLGLDHIKITEHYLGAYGGYSPSPINFLAAASQRTRQIRLITGCVLPTFHHPVQLAAELAMLDSISNGRLEVGFARAWLPKEFDALGISMEGSRATFVENVEVITRLWTEQSVTHTGSTHQFTDVTIYTRTVQTPHPPIWIAVTMTPQSYTWAGTQGYNLMVTLLSWEMLKTNLKLYHEAHQKAGRGPINPEQILLGIPVYVAANKEQAFADIGAAYRNTQRVITEASNEWKTTTSNDYKLYHHASLVMEQNYRNPRSLENEIQNGKLIAGSPHEVYEQLLSIEERLGISNFSLFFTFGGLELSKAQQSLALFGQHTLPRLRQHSQAVDASPTLLKV
jgi:alkanesulfonate monooxygenase SsuD/methylene tetrahydromethanopterin reductase-like flavin-dependent oxidoreductase (luciferase family)